MLVTVLKETYVIVLSESSKDERWLSDAGYDPLGEDYFQEIFKDLDALVEEVNYLQRYGAVFEDSKDNDSPFKVVEDLKLEGFI